ncbi:MAG TPA: hypothetical protein VFJ72_10735 [Rubrobacteraceae bacterium]|nr:hypothetical protein [Rubrobacteraceae bacterium]
MSARVSARAPRDAASDYRAKLSHEAARLARKMREAGHQPPLGDPGCGLMVVIEQPVGPRVLDALSRSLSAIGLSDAYVTAAGTGRLYEEALSTEPSALVAVGPGAAQGIDALDHPLALRSYSDATQGQWFDWTKGTAGLLLPPLAPALDDEEAKRRFWTSFLALRQLAPRAL